MSMDVADLFIKVDTTDLNRGKDALGGFAKAGNAADTQTKNLTSSTLQLGKAAVVMAASFAAFKAVQYAQEAASLYARYETLGVVMRTVGNNAGYTGGQMEAAAKSLQKTGISMVESRQQVVRLVQAHIDLASASKLARIAQDAAVIGNVNSSESFARLVHGIQSGQTEVLRTIGINISMENSYKTLAQQLGITTGQLTQAQKTQAVLNAVMKEGEGIAGTYEAAMGTAGKQLLSMQRYTENLKLQIGETFNEALIIAVMAATDGLKGLNQEAQDLAVTGQFREWGRNSILAFAVVGDAVMVLVSLIKELYQEIVFFGQAASLVMKGEFAALGDLTKARANEFRANVDSYGALTKSALARFDLMDKERENQVTLNDVTGKTQINTVETEINSDALKKAAAARKSAIDAAQSYLVSLRQETEQIGLNNIQRKMMDASYAAGKAPTEGLRLEIMTAAQEWGQLTQAQEEGALAEKTRIENLAILARAEKKSADDAAAYWKQLGSTIESTGRFAFISFAANGMKAMDSIKASFKMMMAEIAYQLAKKWVMNLAVSGTMGGASGAASASPMDTLFSAASMISAGKTIYQGFSGALTSGLGSVIGGIGSALGSSSAAAFGAGLAAVGTEAAAITGAAGFLAAGGSGAAAGGGAAMAGAMGVRLASLLGPAALVIAALYGVYKLFSFGPSKPQDAGISGTFGPQGFEGVNFQDWKKKSIILGTKRWTTEGELDPRMAERLSAAMALVRSSTETYAKVLLLPVDAIAGYTKRIRLVLTGNAEGDKKAIDEMFLGIADELANLTGNFEKFIQEGETAATTLKRLAIEYTSVDAVLYSIGRSFGAVGLASMEARERLINLAGGMDAFAQKTKFYSDNFLTSEQRMAPAQREVLEQMAAMGLSAFTTKKDFAALVHSLDLTGEVGAATYAKLMNIAPAFAAVADAATAAIEVAEAAATAAIGVAQAGVDTAKANLLTSYHTEKTLLEGVISKFAGFATAILLLNSGLVSGADAAEGAYRAQVQLARAGNESAISGLGGAQQAYLTAKLATASTSLEYQRIVGSVMSTNTMLASDMSAQADKATAQLDALNKQVGLLINLNESMLSVRDAIAGLASATSTLKSVTASATSTLKSVTAGAGVAQAGMSTNETFVTSLYNQLLGRAPDAAGLAGWTAALAGGASTASVIAGFTGSQEYMGSHADGLDRVPFDGYVAQLHSGERIKTAAAARQEDAVASEVRGMRVELNAALVAIALNTGDTAKRIRKFDGEGLPATRT